MKELLNIKIQMKLAEEVGNAQVRSPASDLDRWAGSGESAETIN
jgi:hypothetical protein